MKINLCLDELPYSNKPLDKDAARINATITQNEKQVALEELAQFIGTGHSFCPTCFSGQKKTQDEFKSQQIFALDFDGEITLDEARKRAKYYGIEPAIIYETFSSSNYNRFRFLFCHCTNISSAVVARTIQLALCNIFTEADKSSKDFTKLYYGGMNVINTGKIINAYSLLLALTNRFKDIDYNHAQRLLNKFSRQTRLILENGVFKVDLSAADQRGTSFLSLDSGKNGEIITESLYIYGFRSEITTFDDFELQVNKYGGRRGTRDSSGAARTKKEIR